MNHSNHSTGGGGGHGAHGAHGMARTIDFGYEIEDLFGFPGLRINSAGAMAGACVVMFGLAVLYVVLKVVIEMLHQRKRSRGRTQEILSHVLQTLLHVGQLLVSYLLTSYNGYLCMAMLAGTATGYLLFGWMTEHPGWSIDGFFL